MRTITIYSTSDCGICRSLMHWLDGKSIAYRKIVVDEEPQGMSELMTVSEGRIGVPFTVIDNDGQITKVSGFDRRAIEQAIV